MKLLADLTAEQVRLQNKLRENLGLDPIPDPDTMLYCKTCDKWKPDEEFYRHSKEKGSKNRGRRYECKPCNNNRRRQWRANNRERENKSLREWRRKVRLSLLRDPVECSGCGNTLDKRGLARHQRRCMMSASVKRGRGSEIRS